MRICNFELAVELQCEPTNNLIDLQIEACSIIYASPLILDFFTSSASPSSSSSTLLKAVITGITQGGGATKNIAIKRYNPFKEDVFSLGLTLLQLALFCNC